MKHKLFIIFENFQSCRHFRLPFAPGARDFRLDSFRLFYLREFSLVVHAKCRQGLYCMGYEVKFT